MNTPPSGLKSLRGGSCVIRADSRAALRVLHKLTGPHGMPPARIKARITRAGHSLETLAWHFAHRNGRRMSAADVWQVIDGKAVSITVADYISTLIGEPVSVLWPRKYPLLEAEQLINHARAKAA